MAAARNQGPHNLDSIFKSMDVVDRAQILDKIHKMRMRVADKRGPEEPTKPHLPKMTGNDKDKLMAQYFAAKRSMVWKMKEMTISNLLSLEYKKAKLIIFL